MVLPMNTGAEAVETAIKTARKWGYEVKGVPDGQAVIIAFEGNFHGRTTTIVSFSTDDDARASYGPYTPGFRVVPYGDLDALTAAFDDRVVGVLVEPIQGEAGVLVPPPGFLAALRSLCTEWGASTRTWCRTCTCWARRWVAASSRCRRWCRALTCWACSSRGSTGRRSAATRWPARSAAR
jgi:hypothetical protein